jgi:integrase
MRQHRGHNEGTIFERKDRDGNVIGYRAQVSMPGGKRKSVSGRTKSEVMRKLREAQVQLHQGTLVAGRSANVGAYLDGWLDGVRTTRRPRTVQSYELNVARLRPHLGGIRLDALRPAHLDAAYGALMESGLSPRSVEQAATVLHTALRKAVKLELLVRNPADSATPPRPQRREMHTLSASQVRALFAATETDRLRALWILLVTTGLRSGEAVGLLWEDLDLDAGRLTVRRALQRQKGKGLVFVDTKTHRSRRNIALPAVTVAALRTHRIRQATERLAAGWKDEGLVFTNADGRRLCPSNVHESLQRRLKRAGLPPIRVHDLRHTAATLHLAGGTNPKVVQELLGHSTITLTLDTYSHVIEGLQEEAARTMDALVGGGEPANRAV